MPKFKDIPKLTDYGQYRIDVSWDYLEHHIARESQKEMLGSALDLNPDFQRGYVWTPAQKSAYVEFILKVC